MQAGRSAVSWRHRRHGALILARAMALAIATYCIGFAIGETREHARHTNSDAVNRAAKADRN